MWLQFFILTASLAILVSSKKADNDIEVKANIRMHPRLIQHLKQNLEDELEIGYFRGDADRDVPVMEQIKDNVLHELLKDSLPEIASEGVTLLTKIQMYEQRSQQKGKDSLQAVGAHIQSKLELPQDNVTSIVEDKTADYMHLLHKYFSDLAREKPDCSVDEEYLILDMANVVPLIRGSIEKKLLQAILSSAKDIPEEEIEILTSTILAFNDNDKRQEMDFMCASFKVCRPNPTFSSYLYILMEEVLNLNNAKFLYFLTKCSQLLLNMNAPFDTVLRDDIVTVLRKKLNNMATENVTKLRDTMLFLHSIVPRRYKINHSNDKKIQTRAKSAYIILDIVDTAFGIDGSDLYGTQLEKTTSSVRDWSVDMKSDVIDSVLYDFIQYVIEALNYNLNQRAREEIMTLSSSIYSNTPGNQNVTHYLMTTGSKFVNGLINRPEPKKLW